MTAYDRLTMALSRRREQLFPQGPRQNAGHSAAVLDLLTHEERTEEALSNGGMPPTLHEALAAMGFSCPAEVDAWNDHLAPTNEDIVARYQEARDVIRRWVAATGLRDLMVDHPKPRTRPKDPIERAIKRLVSIFLRGDREHRLSDILQRFPPTLAGYIVFQVTARLARRSADNELNRLGCWLAVQGFQERGEMPRRRNRCKGTPTPPPPHVQE